MKTHSLVYVTTPDREIAIQLAHGAVKAGLAACANIIPGMTSVYQWEGRLNEDQEVVLLFKTTEEAVSDLTAFIKTRHPYKTPAVLALPVTAGNTQFLEWISSCVTDRRG
ncbi:MAG: hypothetical protein RIQ81_396 [Pseudomonadota bacterium]|jgi:periplasmic divalent cation tolerance protein